MTCAPYWDTYRSISRHSAGTPAWQVLTSEQVQARWQSLCIRACGNQMLRLSLTQRIRSVVPVGLLLFMAVSGECVIPIPAPAPSVALAWDQSTDPTVT